MVDAPPAPRYAIPPRTTAGEASVGSARPHAASGGPAPGELGIKERRSWRTWQLLVFGLACLLLGMLIAWSGNGGGQSTPKTSTGGNYRLPPPTGGSSSVTTAPGAASVTTQAPAALSPTSPSSSAPTTTTTSGTLQVLLGPTPQTHGNWTSSTFTIGSGTWSIGWAFQCTPAPVSGPSFQVLVVPAGGKAGSTPAVNESGASGQSITTQTSTGSQELEVTAPAACVWIVKVSGVS